MKKFSDLPLFAQLGIFLIVPVLVIATCEFFYFPFASNGAGDLQDWQAANVAAKDKLKKLQEDNKTFKPFEARLKQIQLETKQMQAQLENLRNVVPVEKDTDSFIKMVRAAGDQTGIQVRRFTPTAPVAKEFYMELPFEVEMDGNWHSLTQFLERISALPRIANVGSLGIGPIGSSVKGVHKHYDYSPTETIQAGCTITTFYRKPETAAPAKK